MVLTLSRQFVTLTGTGKAVRVFLEFVSCVPFIILRLIRDFYTAFVCYRMAALPIATSLLLMFALTWLHTTESYPHGAPPTTCSAMSPKHQNVSPQQSLPPFAVTAGKLSVAPGSTLKLMLSSATGAPFKGFLLQARQPEGSDAALGQFTALPNLTKPITCAGGYQVNSNNCF